MGIGLSLAVTKGRIPEDLEEPSVAYTFDPDDDLSFRELNMFYSYLKFLTRETEKIIDDFIEEQIKE